MSNRDDFGNVARELLSDPALQSRLETELHNAYVAGQEQAKPKATDPDSAVVDGDGAIDLTIGGLMISVEIHKGDSVGEIVRALLAKLESR